MKKNIRMGLTLCLTSFTLGATIPAATAAEVAPGAPIRMEEVLIEGMPEPPLEVPLEVTTVGGCSLGLPGTVTLADGTQRNVLVTAGHCLYGVEGDVFEVKPEVYAPLHEGRKLIAQREHGQKVGSEDANVEALYFPEPDWATAEVVGDAEMSRVADSVDQYGRRHGKPVVLTGVRDYRDLGEREVAFDNLGQPICKDGQTSGRTCGIQLMRTRNAIWSIHLYQGGDSGGVNFDPITGEALGVTSASSFIVIGIAQPIDLALEEAYGIPDGQVNERFALPDSTQPHTPAYTLEEDEQQAAAWWDQNFPVDESLPVEPPTLEEAQDYALVKLEEGIGEVWIQTQDAANQLAEVSSEPNTIASNAVETANYLGGLAESTARVYGEAVKAELSEEIPEEWR